MSDHERTRRVPRRRALLAAVPAVMALAVAGLPASPAAAADQNEYVMRLSSTSATVTPGGGTRTVVSFESEPYLSDTRVQLSVEGLPSGATAAFTPATPLIGGYSVLTIRTASVSRPSATTISVIAMTFGGDPIGTSATFSLTVAGPG